MKRNKYILGMVMSMNLLMVTLTACASKETEEVKEAEIVMEEVIVEEKTAVEAAETVTDVDEVPESLVEVTSEPIEEPQPEPVVYEGIDMESPFTEAEWGSQEGEWVGTFYGIINEPKFVVTNVERNKKVIVEEGQKVVLEEGDFLGVYHNGGIVVGQGGIPAAEMVYGYGNTYSKWELGTITEETVFEVTIATLEGDKTISCILVPNE